MLERPFAQSAVTDSSTVSEAHRRFCMPASPAIAIECSKGNKLISGKKQTLRRR